MVLEVLPSKFRYTPNPRPRDRDHVGANGACGDRAVGEVVVRERVDPAGTGRGALDAGSDRERVADDLDAPVRRRGRREQATARAEARDPGERRDPDARLGVAPHDEIVAAVRKPRREDEGRCPAAVVSVRGAPPSTTTVKRFALAPSLRPIDACVPVKRAWKLTPGQEKRSDPAVLPAAVRPTTRASAIPVAPASFDAPASEDELVPALELEPANRRQSRGRARARGRRGARAGVGARHGSGLGTRRRGRGRDERSRGGRA